MSRSPRALVVALLVGLASPALVAAETWTLDPAHTVSGFTVRHMMITNVTGVFESTRGTIRYNLGDLNSVAADIVIETKSVNTRDARRDDDLRGDSFFSAEKYPTITFKSKRVRNVGAGGFDLVGDLTIRDVTREVVLRVEGPTGPIKDARGNRRMGATEAGSVVSDEVKINLEVSAVERKG